MSYRSFKRVLGDTSLERKCRFLFGAALLILITGSFYWYGQLTEQLVDKNTVSTARQLVDFTVLQEHWAGWEKDANPEMMFDVTVDDLAKILQTQPYSGKIINPRRHDMPERQFEDELDRYAWTELNKPDPVPFIHTTSSENGEYRFYQAIRAKQACFKCHNGWMGNPELGEEGRAYANSNSSPKILSENELMAVARVTFPDTERRADINKNRAWLIATGIITAFLAMIALYVIVRYVIVKPLKHLRDVSDEVSHGNTSLRAEIHTADEFEELGLAFNRMLRHLVEAQEGLRGANTDLDAKVDELAQANMRLYELNRLKSDFLATMSHELRTPLNSILGFSDVLGSIDSLNDKQKRYVQNIQKSGRMLLDMINDILDLAKIESGKMEVRLTEFRIEQVISAQCDMARPLTEKKNIDLETSVEPNLPELFQDQGKVQQILNNLLSNAIKFTPEGGRISVRARQSPRGDLLLTVADTGVGIADEDQVAIFEKFRQGRAALADGDAMTREYSGTGLGLSIVKELCKLLGGEITLHSELGKGSTFTVRLPWTRADQPKLESPLEDNIEELIRPRRMEYQRAMEHPVAGPTGRSS